MAERRDESGVSYESATYAIREFLPRALWVSTGTVRRIETKADPDPVLAMAIARAYGAEWEDVPEELREGFTKVTGVMPSPSSAWFTAVELREPIPA